MHIFSFAILCILSCIINASPVLVKAHSEDDSVTILPPTYHEDRPPPSYEEVGNANHHQAGQHWLNLPPSYPMLKHPHVSAQEHSPLCHKMSWVQYAWTHTPKRRIIDLSYDEVYELEHPFKSEHGTHNAFIKVIRGEFTKEDLINVQNLSRVQLLLAWAHEGHSTHYIVVKQIGKFAQDVHLTNQQLQDLMSKAVTTYKKKYSIYLTDLFNRNDRNFTFGKDIATPISWPPEAVRYTDKIPKSSEGEPEMFC